MVHIRVCGGGWGVGGGGWGNSSGGGGSGDGGSGGNGGGGGGKVATHNMIIIVHRDDPKGAKSSSMFRRSLRSFCGQFGGQPALPCISPLDEP